MKIESKVATVDNIETHYLEAGSGRPIVLLHSGEFGSSADLSWRTIIPALAERYHVIAPDWLGFGGTAKLYDFVGGRARRLDHMSCFLRSLDLGPTAFLGSSMGGSDLVRAVASGSGTFDAEVMLLSSSGGFSPDNEARRILLDYDATLDGMRRIIGTLFIDPSWAQNEKYIAEKYAASIAPGAWECLAAARFRSPAAPVREHFGQADTTRYEDIGIPVMLVAGERDPLRLPDYALELGARIPDAHVHVYEETGHFPHIERAERFNTDALDFLDMKYPA